MSSRRHHSGNVRRSDPPRRLARGTTRPPGVVVSDDLMRRTKPTPRRSRSATTTDEVPQGPSEPVEPPHDEAVPGPGLAQEVVEGEAGLELAAGLVHEDPVAAGGVQGIELEGFVLLQGADAGTPEPEAAGVLTSRNYSAASGRVTGVAS